MADLNDTEEVIFVTSDEELNALMLEAYPGIIKGEQHCTDILKGKKVYVFKDLQLNEITNFLENHKNYEYKVI